MKTRKIGSFEVSEVAMGCMAFSHGYGRTPSEDYAISAIRAAFEAGCTHFDTAESYGDVVFHAGHNEELVGKALAPFRGDVTIATKFRVNETELKHAGSQKTPSNRT